MGNPVPTQVRSVDPYASYNSDVVNKLTRIVSDGNNGLLMPSPVGLEYLSTTTVKATAGKAIIQDVLIETQDLTVDFTDPDFYLDNTGFWSELGYHYVVLQYEYQKVSPPPESSILIIQPSQRGTLYDPSKQVFLGAVNVTTGPIVSEVLPFDPENPNIGRTGMGGGVAGSSIEYIESSVDYYATPEDDTISIDSSGGDRIVYLPPVNTTNRIIRVVKISPDANTITVTCGTGDTIEGYPPESVETILRYQYDEVTLAPYPTNNVWIEI